MEINISNLTKADENDQPNHKSRFVNLNVKKCDEMATQERELEMQPVPVGILKKPARVELNLSGKKQERKEEKYVQREDERRVAGVRVDNQLRWLLGNYERLNKVSHRHFDWVAGARVRGNYSLKVVLVYKSGEARSRMLQWFPQELVGYRSTTAMISVQQIRGLLTNNALESITLVEMPIIKDEDF